MLEPIRVTSNSKITSTQQHNMNSQTKEHTDGRIRNGNEKETEGDLSGEKEQESPKIHRKHPNNLQRAERGANRW